MKLIPLAGTACSSKACPTVFVAEGDDLVVQGYVVPDQRDGSIPAGEARVRIPRHLLLEAARKLPELD